MLALSSCSEISIKKHTPRSFTTLKDIPQQCKDSNKIYKAINTILSKSAYNVKTTKYQPIHNTKGFISTDFENNGVDDFLFKERFDSNCQ